MRIINVFELTKNLNCILFCHLFITGFEWQHSWHSNRSFKSFVLFKYASPILIEWILIRHISSCLWILIMKAPAVFIIWKNIRNWKDQGKWGGICYRWEMWYKKSKEKSSKKCKFWSYIFITRRLVDFISLSLSYETQKYDYCIIWLILNFIFSTGSIY